MDEYRLGENMRERQSKVRKLEASFKRFKKTKVRKNVTFVRRLDE